MDGTTEPGEGRDRELGVFLPMLHERVARAIATGQRFVHYTGAPAAMSMIRGGELWLRNTQCMNDFSEVRYGLDMLDAVYNSDDGRRLIDFVESVHPGIRAAVRERVAGLGDTIAYGTYIACLSEHDPAEDGIGRLSMWRAYSGASGVALVLRNPILVGPGSDRLGVFTGPVVYDGRDAFAARFARFVEGILSEGDYLARIGPAHTARMLMGSYHFAALATKHPGFAEEREWRIVFTPSLQAGGELIRAVEVCRGEPQIVHKLPLVARPGPDGASTALADILDALIIGPCAAPRALRDAFVGLLDEAGVPDAAAKVRISDIPIR